MKEVEGSLVFFGHTRDLFPDRKRKNNEATAVIDNGEKI